MGSFYFKIKGKQSMLNKTLLIILTFNLLFSQVFFSEYAEGSSNNKYLEIYNAGDSVIDLTGYAFPSTANAPSVAGEHEYWNEFEVGATINPGDVYVICHGAAAEAIQPECDAFHTYLSNGNDGYCLVSGTEDAFTIVDCIGDWNADPGAGWDVAGVTAATTDHTLVRKTTVMQGNGGSWEFSAGTDADDSEWVVYELDTWDYLGNHTIDNSGNVYGCMDASACNYNLDATVDNGTCAAEDCLGECGGSATIDGCGICGGENATMDCEGVCDGSAIEDECGICNGDGSTNCDEEDLFFSEYSEGSSYNKYIEIYNGTGQDLDLSSYEIWKIANGGAWPEYTLPLSAIILANDVYVICSASADAAILAECDETWSSANFNGDDAMGLAFNSELIDQIGEAGADVGDGWDVAGISEGTKDHTLVRKASVSSGNTDWAVSAGTNENDSEWIVYEKDTWDYLGNHTLDNPGDGCMDASACNYDPDATTDNGSCATEDCLGDCGGSAVIDDCGVCGGENDSLDCENVCGGDAIVDYCGECVGGNTGQEPCELEESSILNIINNCSSDLGSFIDCDGQYNLSASSASQCPLYEQPVITSGVIVDYFDITPYGGPHSFTLQDAGGNNIDFVVWPTSSEYQDGFDITTTDLNVLTQEPFGVYEVQITGELGAYCDDDEQLDISNEWQITVEYESDILFTLDENPVAVIGDDLSVDFGDTVTLDGTSSYAYGDGSIVSYYWNQVSGTSVFYGEPEASSISFVAPSEFSSLVFSLQVTDDSGATSVDYITITVGSVGEVAVSDIINNCSFESGDTISCDGQYDLSTSSASECPLYGQSLTTSGVIVDYFDITPFNGPHSFTLQDASGNNIDFVVWPTSSAYQDGFDITTTDLNVLTQEPFGVYEVQITGELGAYCDDDEQLDISNEWQITVEYESDIIIDGGGEDCMADGDANGDGIVNVVDIVQIVSLILGNPSGYNECGDVNNDGILNVVDIVAVVSVILGN